MDASSKGLHGDISHPTFEKKEFLESCSFGLKRLKELVETTPSPLGPLLKKALVLCVGDVREKEIKNWPDAIKTAGYVDAIMTLDNKVTREGLSTFDVFGNIAIPARKIISAAESVVFGLQKDGPEGSLVKAVLPVDWHAQLEDFLLRIAEESCKNAPEAKREIPVPKSKSFGERIMGIFKSK